ncbi:MAG: hypothetical protein ABFS38_03945 [Bacteroidota bacterium]
MRNLNCFNRLIATLCITLFSHTVFGQMNNADPIPVIHVADLYHPHGDPDDHWDLATIYSQAFQGDIELKAILIDYTLRNHYVPDVMGVAQMNRLTGLAVPVMVGSPYPMQTTGDIQPGASIADHSGINMILDILRSADRPVIIHVVGHSRDIAIAGKKSPELFAEKCAGIYLNAGTALGINNDYNVNLDPVAFSAIFDLPCPVYWAPCVQENYEGQERKRKGEYSTWFSVREKEILTDIPPGTQKFIAYMYRHGRFQEQEKQYDGDWVSYLDRPVEKDVIEEHAKRTTVGWPLSKPTSERKHREMWCTPGFLHAAGKTVTKDGQIVSLDSGYPGVFTFEPVQLEVEAPREIKWSQDTGVKDRYIFRITDMENYETAMGRAFMTLLKQLP